MNKTLSSSFAAVLSVAGVSSIPGYVQAQQPVKPNVIYIYADDMGKVCCRLMVNGISRHLILMRWLPGGLLSIMHTVVCCQLRQEPLC